MNITLCDTGQYIHMSMLQTHQNVRKWNSQHPLKKNIDEFITDSHQSKHPRCVTETTGTFSVCHRNNRNVLGVTHWGRFD